MPHKPLMNSALSYYFRRIPFPLKQKHPLNYIIKNFCFLPDCTKRLFFGNGKQKRAIEQPSPRLIYIPFSFYRFSHIQTRKLCILSRKPLYYLENTHRVSVIIQAVSVFVYGFCLRVYTIRQNNPRTKVRTLANVKMPLKAHGNNVTLESM